MEPNIFKFIKNDKTFLEKEPLTKLGSKKINAFKHNGFWQCMDTIRDKEILEKELRIKNTLIIKNCALQMHYLFFY